MEVYNKTVNSLEEYIQAIKEINESKKTFSEFIYRGQADEGWKLSSGVYRRFEMAKKDYANPAITNEEITEYLKERIRESRKREASHPIIKGMNELNLLAEMQHYGAATNLIDFSHSSLIALYMAASEGNKVNGKVFCINYKDSEQFSDAGILQENNYGDEKTGKSILDRLENKIYSFSPWHSNSRIIKQESIFLFNREGIIKEDRIDFVIIIDKDYKEKIIESLAKIAGITEETIYPDFLGYLQANASKKKLKVLTADDYFRIALDFQLVGKYETAIEYYLKAIEIRPNKDITWYNMGNAYSVLGNWEKAIECYSKAIEIKPDKDIAWYNMGVNYSNLGNKEKAIECYTKSIEIRPDDMAWYNMGNSYDDLGNKEKAVECFTKAIEIKPDKDIAWYNMGIIYSDLGNKEKAIECYASAIEINPGRDSAWYNMGVNYFALGNKNKAIEYYVKAIEIKPDKDHAWYNMGIIYSDLGNKEKATECYKRAYEIDPKKYDHLKIELGL